MRQILFATAVLFAVTNAQAASITQVNKAKGAIVVTTTPEEKAPAKSSAIQLTLPDNKQIQGKVVKVSGNKALIKVTSGIENAKVGAATTIGSVAASGDDVDLEAEEDTTAPQTATGTQAPPSPFAGFYPTASDNPAQINRIENKHWKLGVAGVESSTVLEGEGIEATSKQSSVTVYGQFAYRLPGTNARIGAGYSQQNSTIKSKYKVGTLEASGKTKASHSGPSFDFGYGLPMGLGFGLAYTQHSYKTKFSNVEGSTSYSTLEPGVTYTNSRSEFVLTWEPTININESTISHEDAGSTTLSYYRILASKNIANIEITHNREASVDSKNNKNAFDLQLGHYWMLDVTKKDYVGLLFSWQTNDQRDGNINVFGFLVPMSFELQQNLKLQADLGVVFPSGRSGSAKYQTSKSISGVGAVAVAYIL